MTMERNGGRKTYLTTNIFWPIFGSCGSCPMNSSLLVLPSNISLEETISSSGGISRLLDFLFFVDFLRDLTREPALPHVLYIWNRVYEPVVPYIRREKEKNKHKWWQHLCWETTGLGGRENLNFFWLEYSVASLMTYVNRWENMCNSEVIVGRIVHLNTHSSREATTSSRSSRLFAIVHLFQKRFSFPFFKLLLWLLFFFFFFVFQLSMDPTSNWLPVFLFYSSIVSLSLSLSLVSTWFRFWGLSWYTLFGGVYLLHWTAAAARPPFSDVVAAASPHSKNPGTHPIFTTSLIPPLFILETLKGNLLWMWGRVKKSQSVALTYVYWYFLFHLLFLFLLFSWVLYKTGETGIDDGHWRQQTTYNRTTQRRRRRRRRRRGKK